ncbi:uncharacterized protein LOC134841214 isoform X2 [Symsagittifera roscoffensis]|uniref:uncharacterized protein LOC134841214 isoform X1 n=2 Tax=Symsagittifera roscoffensis TaxID=84072 RepID=UPI00307B3C82
MRSDNRRPNQPPRLPPNPTRVDRLVGEMQKEHPKVLMLISKADEVLRQWQDIVSQPIPPEVIITMDQWLAAIRKVQARRREDTNSQANRQRHLPVGPVNGFMPGMNNMQGGNSSRGHDDKDRIALCQAVKELAEITRKARNMQWVFLQFTREAVQKIQNHSNDVAQESNMSSVNALLAEATEKRLLSEDSEDSVFESLPRQIWSTAEGGFF